MFGGLEGDERRDEQISIKKRVVGGDYGRLGGILGGRRVQEGMKMGSKTTNLVVCAN